LERELNSTAQRGSPKVEVISFGVGGYGLAPQYLTLQRHIWQYDPQIVLVVNPHDGLVLRSSRRLYPGDSFGAPFFELRDGALQFDRQTLAHRNAAARSHSLEILSANLMNQMRLLSLVNSARVRGANDARRMMSGFQTRAATLGPLPVDYWKTYGYLGPANAELRDAWDISEALILAMRDEAARHGAELWLCLLDSPPQVDPEPQIRLQFQKSLGVDTLFRADRMLADFASQAGIPHMTLAPDLARFAEARHVVLHGFPGMPRNTGHLNENGHSAVGSMIARILRQQSPRLAQGTGEWNGN
jgi:hypothetical protein